MKLRSFKQITVFTSLFLALTACGYENIVPPHVHTFSTEWTHNADYHWHEATCEHKDVKGDYGVHIWGSWIIDRIATEQQNGLRHHQCSKCLYNSEPVEYEYVTGVDATRIYLKYIAPSNSVVGVGSTKTLTPVIFPENAKKNIKYIVDKPAVLSVDDETGVVTGLQEGTSLITLYNDNNSNGVMDESEPRNYTAYEVKNKNANYSVSLDASEYTVMVDNEITLSPRANGWTISDERWGTYGYNSPYITTDGLKIKGVKPGQATVVVYVTPKNESVPIDTTVTINVVDNTEGGLRANSVSFTDKVVNLSLGDEYTPEYTVYPSNSIDTAVTLSSKGDVLSYANGKFTANKAGTAVIDIATPNGKTDRMKVVVSDTTHEYTTNYHNYYGDLTWTDGADLKAKLHAIISNGKNDIKYVIGSTNNWETNQAADSLISNDTMVNVLYRDDPIGKTSTGTGTEAWQREHCFAATLMSGISTGNAVKSTGRATDFHNLYAAFGRANGARGNKDFGYADKGKITYADNGGSYKYETNGNFEPSDVDKGKVARAIFYMATMYDSEEQFTYDGYTFKAQPLSIIEDYVSFDSTTTYASFTNSGNAPKELANKYVEIVKKLNPEVTDETQLLKLAYSYYMGFNNPSAIGNLSHLLMWNSFPVDNQEMQHNNMVYAFKASSKWGGHQGNRNPFVDYPELVEYVFGSKQDEAGSLKNLKPAIEDLDVDLPDDPTPGPTPTPSEDLIFEDCKYQFETATKPQDLVNDETGVATFGTLTWNFSCKNTLSYASYSGLKVTSDSTEDTWEFTLETEASLEDVDGVVLRIYCPKQRDYTYDLYVGDDKVASDVSLRQENAAITDYPNAISEAKTGKVKIVFKNLTSYISIKGLAINYK